MNTKRLVSRTMSIALSISVLLCQSGAATTKAEDTMEYLQSRQQFLVQEENRLENILNGLKDQDSKREEYVKALEEQINIFCEQIDVENKKTFLLDEEIKLKEAQIEKAQIKIDEHMEKFKQRLRAIFKAGGDTAFISTILKSNSIKDCLNVADVAQVIGKHDTKLFEELNSEMIKVEEEKDKVETKKKDIEESKVVLEGKRKELEKIQEENKQILEERARRLEQASRLASMSVFHSENVPDYSNVERNGKYLWPVPGYNKITSYWGDNRGHKGIDISSSGIYGAAIVAVADGVVTTANSSDQWGSGWGYHVKIDHGSGYATQYAHCSLVTVSCGQTVKAGQIIGYVGNTGNSYGAHLHFETWKDGSRYDPMKEL